MSEREEARTCVRCGVTDTAVLDLDTGSACHPEWRDCVAALRYFLREQDSDLFTLRQKLTTAERERDEARRERDEWRDKWAVSAEFNAVHQNRAERAERVVEAARAFVDAGYGGEDDDAEWMALHEAVRALVAAEGTP